MKFPASLPNRGRVLAWLRFLGIFYITFFPVYLGCGWLALQSDRALSLYMNWELSIPLLPEAIWPYVSLYPLFMLPMFHLGPDEMRRLSNQSTVSILIAGVCFLAIPGKLGYAPVHDLNGLSGQLLTFVKTADQTGNLVPSLHVAFTVLIIFACIPTATLPLATTYIFWMILLVGSTLFTHQHHVIDLIAGAALALGVRHFMPLRILPAVCQKTTRPASL